MFLNHLSGCLDTYLEEAVGFLDHIVDVYDSKNIKRGVIKNTELL